MAIVKCEFGHNVERSEYYKYSNAVPTSSRCNICKINTLNNIINNNDGYLLSGIPENSLSVLELKCNKGHVWKTKFVNLKCDNWCRDCASENFKYEKICRLYFEKIFQKFFVKKRPNFLKNKNGKNLELDGFNDELKIAFEHQGMQHYKIIKHFKMDENKLNSIQSKDKLKIKLCDEFGIKLFIIPELFSITKIENLKQCIYDQSVNFGIEKLGNFEIEINLFDLKDDDINEYKEIAILKGGKCLSDNYINAFFKLDFICKNNHKWSATPTSIKHNDSWCSDCCKNKIMTINEMHVLAENNNGKCLSNEYKGNNKKLKWQCIEGHIWFAEPRSIKNNNSWCKICYINNRKNNGNVKHTGTG